VACGGLVLVEVDAEGAFQLCFDVGVMVDWMLLSVLGIARLERGQGEFAGYVLRAVLLGRVLKIRSLPGGARGLLSRL
jgi:hypothetical protein